MDIYSSMPNSKRGGKDGTDVRLNFIFQIFGQISTLILLYHVRFFKGLN